MAIFGKHDCDESPHGDYCPVLDKKARPFVTCLWCGEQMERTDPFDSSERFHAICRAHQEQAVINNVGEATWLSLDNGHKRHGIGGGDQGKDD